MEKELFGAIRDNYYVGSKNLWTYFKTNNFLLKIIFLPWVLIVSFLLIIIGFFFSLGVILDKFTLWLSRRRNSTVNIINQSSNNLKYYKAAYFVTPIKIILLSPICLFLGIIPKWSSTLLNSAYHDECPSTEIEYNYFRQLGNAYLNLSKSTFKNMRQHGIFFTVIALLASIFATPIYLCLGMIFFSMIILSFFGFFISKIRQFVVSSSYSFSSKTGTSGLNMIVMPILLITFVPVYVFLLMLPNFISHNFDS